MNIIINGGTRGIGRETAIRLASDSNNKILITGRDTESLEKICREAEHKNIIGCQLDLSRFEKITKEAENLLTNTFKNIDILINNAGLLISADFLDFQEDNARLLMETNFFGPSSLIKIVAPLMGMNSHIVNISSMGGFQGSSKFRGLSYYSASKAALACLTECLAEEFSEKGIRVNCLALGSVQTEMLNQAFPGYKAPVDAREMAIYIADFAMNGHRVFNGKVIPVALSNP